METNLSNLTLSSRSFAEILCKETALKNLQDGTLYVLTGDSAAWEESFLAAKEFMTLDCVQCLWHLPYAIEIVSDLSFLEKEDSLLDYYACGGMNFIMPLFTPDRTYKCYLIGKINKPDNLEAAFGLLSNDAQKISNECAFAAFATCVETSPETARKLWFKLIDYNSLALAAGGYNIAFRGKYKEAVSNYTFFGKGFEKSLKDSKIGYTDLMKSLKRFPETIQNLSKLSDKEQFKEEKMNYVKICNSLSAVDKNELILELSKRISDKKILAEAIDAVINKAKSSKLKVKLVKRTEMLECLEQMKEDKRRIHASWCTYLIDENENKQWLDFEPQAHVVYLMNLIHRVNNPDCLAPVDVLKNREAFEKIYNMVYGGNGQEQYNRLFLNVEKPNGNGYLRKRLTDCYKIITNCINFRCSFYNESPSPYLTDFDKPLTINPSMIELPKEFITNPKIQGLLKE